MNEFEQIKTLLPACTREEMKEIFELLRSAFPIHPIELKLNARAEVILEAIDRSSDLTQRGVRGVIAEASFGVNIVQNLLGWTDETPEGDFPYDFLISDTIDKVRVQVKMQRQKAGRPMMANEGYSYLPKDMYVVETQRTRAGIDVVTQESTRPYKFGEFDILAVSMHPSTNEWSNFRFTVCNWLVERPENPKCLLKFQPVAIVPDDLWTDDFPTCVEWLRSGAMRKIWKRPEL